MSPRVFLEWFNSMAKLEPVSAPIDKVIEMQLMEMQRNRRTPVEIIVNKDKFEVYLNEQRRLLLGRSHRLPFDFALDKFLGVPVRTSVKCSEAVVVDKFGKDSQGRLVFGL